MLTLTRKAGERIAIGDSIEVCVVDIGRGKVRIGITAPRGVAIHRGEIVDRIVAQNRAAAGSIVPPIDAARAATRLGIPYGLPGLREHTAFDLHDVDGQPDLRQLVSVRDPVVRLCIVDAELAFEDYPVAAARTLAGLDRTDTIVALVVCLPSDGRPMTVNLGAPLVIDVEARVATQVIFDGAEHPGGRAPWLPRAA